MIINIWSTPRTGSVWLMYHLQSQYKNCNAVNIAAPFEKWQNSTYRIVLPNGRDKFISEWQEGAFFQEYYINKSGLLQSTLRHDVRLRTPQQEAEYHIELFRQIKADQLVIVNSHVPIEKKYFDEMIALSDRNIWIDRRNKRDQLASWVISLASGTFTYFDTAHVYRDPVETFDKQYLIDIIDRIKFWDQCDKTGHEVLSFEDLKFYSGPGFPVDGNSNAWSRLNIQIQNDIDELIREYQKTGQYSCN